MYMRRGIHAGRRRRRRLPTRTQRNLFAHDYTKPAFPCGICGIRESVGQMLLDPLSFEGCSVYLSSDGKQAHHQCKGAGEISYSILEFLKHTGLEQAEGSHNS